jgi:hypothetical protein
MASSFLSFLDHTQRRATVGRTPLDEWSARRRDLYLTTHNTHNRQTSLAPVGFEPTISAGKRPQTYVLDHASTGTGFHRACCYEIYSHAINPYGYFLSKFYPNRTKNGKKLWAKFQLLPEVKYQYSLKCTAFHSRNTSTALRTDLLLWISHNSTNKYG